MNAHEQADLAVVLRQALQGANLVIERPDQQQGNVVGWSEVPAQSVLGRLLSAGWRVHLTDPTSPVPGRVLPFGLVKSEEPVEQADGHPGEPAA